MSSERTFSTSVSHMAKYLVAAIIGAGISIALILLFSENVKFAYVVLPLVLVFLMARHKVVVNDDSVRFTLGLGKQDYALKETLFRYENPAAPISLLRKIGPRNHMLHVQRQGQKQTKMPLNLSGPDFEALIAALKERDAHIEVA